MATKKERTKELTNVFLIIATTYLVMSFCLFVHVLQIKQSLNAEQKAEPPNVEITTAETTTEAELFQYIGDFKITAYCPCVKCCGKSDGITATGTKATAGRTVAVDPSVIPYGTRLYIDGNIYTAEDCGGEIKGNKVDIFFNTHSEAQAFGVQTMGVFILNEDVFARHVAD